MQTNSPDSKLLALLAWWRDAGVTDALLDDPINWASRGDVAPAEGFAWPEKPQAAPRHSTNTPLAPPGRPETRRSMPGAFPADNRASADRHHPPVTPQTALRPPPSPQAPPAATRRMSPAAASARQRAASADSLEALARQLAEFDGCALKSTAKNLCFYRGSATARLMIVGEAPGRDEDLAGKPFVGRAGQLLDRMLAAIGLGEADVHITNIVYWRPPGNRTPTPEEALTCRPFLERQMQLVAPEFVLSLGGPAAKSLLDVTEGIMRLRGRWQQIEIGGRQIPVMPTLHPAYLLRQPEAKRQAWRDLLAIRAALAGTGTSSPSSDTA